jgi:exosortase/archaeosortase family protein
MKKKSKSFLNIFIRYFILILVAIPNLWLFYKIFTPLTLYPTYFILSLFFDVSLKGIIMSFPNNLFIEIIEACVAGSAYYLLLILNLSTPSIKFPKRFKLILISFASLLIVNIIRIVFLSAVFVTGASWFDIAHKVFWYVGSIIFVLVIWFLEVKYYKIKSIPFYSDLKFIYKNSALKK